METERNTFVTSLARFTFLNNLREMKPKNIESIKCLLEVAITEANYLQDCWLPVLRCISLLEQLHVVGSGAAPDFMGFTEEEIAVRDKSKFRSSFIQFKQFQEMNAPIIADQIDSSFIDRIFTNSVLLNSVCLLIYQRWLINNLLHRMPLKTLWSVCARCPQRRLTLPHPVCLVFKSWWNWPTSIWIVFV